MKIEQEAATDFSKKAKLSLQNYCQTLTSLYVKPSSKRPLNKAIKEMQTIKGGASYLELHHIEVLAQASISAMSAVRDKDIEYSEKMHKTLALTVKALSEQIANIEKSNCERSKDYDNLLSKLQKLKQGDDNFSVRLNIKKIDEIFNIDSKNKTPIDCNKKIHADPIENKKEKISQANKPDENKIEQTETNTAEQTISNSTNDLLEIRNDKENMSKYLRHENGKIIITLDKKTSFQEIKQLHQEILKFDIKKQEVDVKASDLNKIDMSLLQLLLSLAKYNEITKINYLGFADNIQTTIQLLLNEKNFYKL